MTDYDLKDWALPTASSAARRARCRGSHNLITELRRAGKLAPETKDSRAAASGNAVHEARASADHEQLMLSYGEKKTLDLLAQIEERLVASYPEELTLIGREQRLWMRRGIYPLFSGRYDYAYRNADWSLVLITDDKTGRLEVAEAKDNDQLRELAALAFVNFPETVQRFDVAIVQPWVTHEPSLATYDRLEAELAYRLLRLSLAWISDPDAARTPGPQCTYCPAVVHCDEARTVTTRVGKVADRIKAGEFDLPLGDSGQKLLDWVLIAERIVAELKAAYKAALEQDPECVPGFYLKEGRRIRELTDAAVAYERLGLELKAFLECGTFSLAKLEEAFSQARDLKPKEAENLFGNILGDLVETRRAAPTLAAIGRKGRAKEVSNATETV